MSNNPLVSIIVRTKDRPKLLERALRSINAQTYRPIEVVLVNDGGCDLNEDIIKEILKDISLNYIKLQENKGRAYAGNVGIENAKGEYIGFLDDDDELYPEHLKTLTDFLFDSDYKVAYTDANIVFLSYDTEKGEMVTKEKRLFSSKDFSFKELIIDNYIPLMCLLFSRTVFTQIGKFDESFEIYEDWDLLIRTAEKFPFYHIKRTTAEYVQWSTNLQIAQTPEFFEKSRYCHIQIIEKHKEKITPEIFIELVFKKRELQERNRIISELEETKLNLEKIIETKEKLISDLNNIKMKLEKELQDKDVTLVNIRNAKIELEGLLRKKDETILEIAAIREKLENNLKEKEGIITGLENIKSILNKKINERDKLVENLMDLKDFLYRTFEKSKYFEIKQSDKCFEDFRAYFEELVKEKEKTISNLKWIKFNLEELLKIKEDAIDTYQTEKQRLEELYLEKEKEILNLEEKINNFDKVLQEKNVLIANLESSKLSLENLLREKDIAIMNLDKMAKDFEKLIRQYEDIIKQKEDIIKQKEVDIENLRSNELSLNEILNSHGWKVLSKYYKFRDRLCPINSRRRLFYNLLLFAIFNPKGVFKSINLYNLKRFFSQYRILDPNIIEAKVKNKIELSNITLEKKSTKIKEEYNQLKVFNSINDFSPEIKGHILVIDRWVPTYDKDSGSLRMFNILNILIELGYKITFLPDDLAKREPYVSEMENRGIEVLYGALNIEKYLENNGMKFNFVILSRPEQAFKYITLVKAYVYNSVVIYDTVDLHWLRFDRAYKVTNNKIFSEKAEYFKSLELFNASCSDVVFTVTQDEKEFLLKENQDLKIEVLPNIHDIVEDIKPFKDRRDLMFIGGFLHQPNEDAVFYFVDEILPKIKRIIPEIKFYVVGSDPSNSLLKLKSDSVIVTGYVKDVMPYFENCRIFVSPLRYGAGMKGKIGQSMGYGLPVVTTTIGAEGIGLIHNENALIADTSEEFANEVVRLYYDEKLWYKLSKNSINHIKTYYSKDIIKLKLKELFENYKLCIYR